MTTVRQIALEIPGRATPAVAVLCAGVLAERFCRDERVAEVAAVFARSFYLRAGNRYICIGTPEIGNGPLTLIAELPVLRLRAGERARIASNEIAVGDLRLMIACCTRWLPPPWPRPAPVARLAAAHRDLARLIATAAPAQSLSRLAAPIAEDSVLMRAARTRLAGFRRWLDDALAAGAATPRPVLDLIGFGPGLTPAGDDCLTGALALLAAFEARAAHAALARAVADSPPSATSSLSGCLLRAAAAGHVGERLARAAAALVSGDAAAAVAALRGVGHGSGWDMLAGMALTLDAALAARPRRRDQPACGSEAASAGCRTSSRRTRQST